MSILQYLANYAEPESNCPPPKGRRYSNVVVVPAFDETPSLMGGLLPAGDEKTLWIVVVNCSEARSAGEKQRTRYLASALGQGGEELSYEGMVLSDTTHGDLLLIDRCTEGREIPAKQGVGLARKIGCDVALAWHHQEIISSPWLHTTDADVTLPIGYFSAARAFDDAKNVVALCYPFSHQTDAASQVGRALQLYEMSLRYYVLGLRWAGSKYAFHTIGSTMAVRFQTYLDVRGMPKREAGEDFYLLGKVAKLGAVRTPDCAPISIAQRESQRTPFGTGPATVAIHEQMRAGEDFCVYNPRSFALVREWLDVLNEFAETCDLDILDRLSHETLKRSLPLDTEKHLRQAMAQCKTPSARAARLTTWFDGFRTLKLVHALRDHGLPDIPWRQAVDSAPFIPEPEHDEKLWRCLARVDVVGARAP
ncbi:MAG: hypothetical protein GY811_02035 [Myxococcales bacterium]|nr:hypothetical protein [Myxococcales bacterium]